MSNDDLGDRMKEYESSETSRKLMKFLPIYARIDGRGFSKFTRGMERPYDTRMTQAMIHATKILVDKTHATVAFVQSDEISLGWTNMDHNSPVIFDGKLHKLHSVLASLATIAFVQGIQAHFEDTQSWLDRMPHFDARVFNVPNLQELANCFLWRNLDCLKNSVTRAAHHYYSHSELQHKNSDQQQEMLLSKGINFNDFPAEFKRGTFVRRRQAHQEFDPVAWVLIPLAHRPPLDQVILRTQTVAYDLPPLSRIPNRVLVLFEDAQPENADDTTHQL
jgi:tRNA(His) guanylyltransferase